MEIVQSLNFFRTIYMINQIPYMLTDVVGIGDTSYMSSSYSSYMYDSYTMYDSFDVIVNVDSHWNNERNVFRDKGKTVYHIGEKTEDMLQIIPELVILHEDNPHFRFLFPYHGMHVAIAFLVKI